MNNGSTMVLALSALLTHGAALAARIKEPPAAEASPPLVTDGQGPKRRSIALDSKRTRAVYKVNAAPGLATVIELPEPWAVTPTCGDCVFGDTKPDGQLWRLDVFPETRSLSIKPTRLPGPDAPASAFVTNIDVTLDGGLTVTLFVELSIPEQADARIEFTVPDADKGDVKVAKRERELEERFNERVRSTANAALLEALLHGTTCRDYFGRPNRSESVVVRLKQLCRNGALVYVTFEIENRRRADLHLATAALESTRQSPSGGERLEKEQLRFNERGLGIAAVIAAAGDAAPTRYRLTVSADGVEAETTVIVDDIEF